jgi:hypothetical protein
MMVVMPMMMTVAMPTMMMVVMSAVPDLFHDPL